MLKKAIFSIGVLILFTYQVDAKTIINEDINANNDAPIECPDPGVELDEYQQAIYNTACAFYYRGRSFQYGDHPMTYQAYKDAINFTTYNITPEDATINTIKNISCDSSINFIYMNAFSDKNGTPYLMEKVVSTDKENFTSEGRYKITEQTQRRILSMAGEKYIDGIYYYNPQIAIYYDYNGARRTVTAEEIATLSAEAEIKKAYIKSILEPGDIITTFEHVMLYLGGDVVLNSSQIFPDRYSSDNKKYNMYYNYTFSDGDRYKHNMYNPYGNLAFISLDDVLLSTTPVGQSDYIKYKNLFTIPNSTYKYLYNNKISIIRPLNEIRESNEYQISDNAKFRAQYPKLVVNKTASVGQYDSVNPGDSITYTIKLENKDTVAYNNLVVTEESYPYYTYITNIEGNYNRNDRQIKWTVSIAPGETKTISYTVKLYAKYEWSGNKIISGNTKIEGNGKTLKLNTIETYSDTTLYSYQEKSLVNRIKSKNGQTVSAGDNIITIAYSNYSEIVNQYKNKSVDDIVNTIFNTGVYELSQYNSKTEFENNVSTAIRMDYIIDDNNKYIPKSTEKTTYTVKENPNELLVKNLIGGRYTVNNLGQDEYDNRIRRFVQTVQEVEENDIKKEEQIYKESKELKVGDVIFIHDDEYAADNSYIRGAKNLYIYLGYNEGKNEFATITNNKIEIITNGSELIDSFLGQNCFAVLRPSYMFENLTFDINNDNIISSSDAYPLANYIVNNESSISEEKLLHVDINNDGQIKMNDIVAMLKQINS